MTVTVVVHLITRSAAVTGYHPTAKELVRAITPAIGALGSRWGREAEVLGVVAQEHTESARTVVPHAVPTIAPSRAIGLRLRPRHARGCNVRSAASPRPRHISTN